MISGDVSAEFNNVTMETKTHIAVIIVSFNTVDLLRRSIASVLRARGASETLAIDCVVVDNASSDGSAEMVAREFPQVYLIASEVNLGFPAANNLAIERLLGWRQKAESAPAPLPEPCFFLLLNPDAEVTPGAIETLVAFMKTDQRVAIAGPALQYGDGSFQHGAFAFPGIAQTALDLFPVGSLRGAHRLYAGSINGRYPQALWQGQKPFPVDFVLGAAMLVRTNAIREIGVMDESYFMYCEEMEWALRAQNLGWRVFAVPSAKVIHHEAQSSRQVRWQSWQRLWLSRLRFFEKEGDSFVPWTELVVRWLVRIAMKRGIRSAHARFGKGEITGTQAADEIAARSAILAAAAD